MIRVTGTSLVSACQKRCPPGAEIARLDAASYKPGGHAAFAAFRIRAIYKDARRLTGTPGTGKPGRIRKQRRQLAEISTRLAIKNITL
jgi:hypothetical protein